MRYLLLLMLLAAPAGSWAFAGMQDYVLELDERYTIMRTSARLLSLSHNGDELLRTGDDGTGPLYAYQLTPKAFIVRCYQWKRDETDLESQWYYLFKKPDNEKIGPMKRGEFTETLREMNITEGEWVVSQKPPQPWYWWIPMKWVTGLAWVIGLGAGVAGVVYLARRGGLDDKGNDRPRDGTLM